MDDQNRDGNRLVCHLIDGGGSRGHLPVWFNKELTPDEVWMALNLMHKEEFTHLQDVVSEEVTIQARKWEQGCEDVVYEIPADRHEQLTLFIKAQTDGTQRVQPGAVSRQLAFRRMMWQGRLMEHPTSPDHLIWEGKVYKFPQNWHELIASPWVKEAVIAGKRIEAVYEKNNKTTGEKMYHKAAKKIRRRSLKHYFMTRLIEGMAQSVTQTVIDPRRR